MNRLGRSLRSPRWFRHAFNLYPPYLMTGIVVTRIDPDWRRVDVAMGLHWYNRNYFGTQFGGNLFAMTDPFLAIMLAQNLGPAYTVWDRSARIDFLRPGRGRVMTRFELTTEALADIRAATATGKRHLPVWPVEVRGEAGETVARVEKTLYVKRRA